MTKKDYELIAGVFARHNKRYGGRTDAVTRELVEDMSEALQDENTRFDSARFKDACYGLEKDENSGLCKVGGCTMRREFAPGVCDFHYRHGWRDKIEL